jgi:polysaccharide export outer membrane protein
MRFAVALAVALSGACGSSAPYVWVDELPKADAKPPTYRVQSGDHLLINVWNQPPLSGEVLVRPDGNITIPLVGDVYVQGSTPAEVADEITKRLSNGIIQAPSVSVSLGGSHEPTVNVTGEVRQGGSFPLRGGEGVLELLSRAGGLSEFANKDKIFVVRKRDQLRVRFTYDSLSRADGAGAAFQLQDGDTVIVE